LRAQVGCAEQKKSQKEKAKVQKKEKFLTKLVVSEDEKGFDAAECRLVDDTLGNEFSNCFPLRNDPILSVMVCVHCLKKVPPNIIYRPFSDIHKDEIKKGIMQCNKFDTKVSIFAILEDPKSIEHIQNHQFFIVGRQHTIVAAKVRCHYIIVLL